MTVTGPTSPSAPLPKRPWRPRPMDFLIVAEAVCGGKADDFGSSWSRAAAFLTRRALEDAVDGVYNGPLLAIRACPMSTKLLCLPRYLGDANLAREVHATWAQLSTACHAHPYELDPTIGELQRWIDVVKRLISFATPAAGAV